MAFPDYVQYTPQVPPKSVSSALVPTTPLEPQYVELLRQERDETGQGIEYFFIIVKEYC